MKILTGKNGEKGAAVIEFAVVVPLLLTLVFGIIEFGVLLYDKAMLTNASREGARAAIVINGKPSLADVKQLVDDYCRTYLITFGSPNAPQTRTFVNSIEMDTGALIPQEDFFTVEVSYDYEFLLVPAFITDIGLKKTLTASTTMRAE